MAAWTQRGTSADTTNTRMLALGLAAGLGAWWLLGRVRGASLLDRVVLITGGSRGLGLLLAHEFARHGAVVVVAARDEQELEEAERQLNERGALADALIADVSDAASAQHLVEETLRRYGQVDVLVNNAGNIIVGPVSVQTREDFERAMGTIFWGTYNTTMAVLPRMRERGWGRIVNIASIGGKVSVPHLLPYGTAKFAAVGLSQGLRAELAPAGIRVTTVVPGLTRTGSYLNANVQGRRDAEFVWFALGASLPLISMDAERAARQIVAATKRGDAEVILSLPAALLARFHGLFPGATADVLGLVARLLPGPAGEGGSASEPGLAIDEQLDSSLLDTLTAWGRGAARRFDEYPADA